MDKILSNYLEYKFKLYPKYPSMIARRRLELEYKDEVDESLSTSKSNYGNHEEDKRIKVLDDAKINECYKFYKAVVGDRKKNETIININGDKRDNRLSNLKIETPLDRLMSHELYPYLNEIVEMQKRNVKLEFISRKFGVTRSKLVWFLYQARKLGVIE